MPSLILNPVLFLHCVIVLLTFLLSGLEGYGRTSTYIWPHLNLRKHENMC
jgi:hypothetical protein